jgi:hypothetical protein
MITDDYDPSQAIQTCNMRAQNARQSAKAAMNERERDEFLRIATEWERLAAEIERNGRSFS